MLVSLIPSTFQSGVNETYLACISATVYETLLSGSFGLLGRTYHVSSPAIFAAGSNAGVAINVPRVIEIVALSVALKFVLRKESSKKADVDEEMGHQSQGDVDRNQSHGLQADKNNTIGAG